MIHVEDESSSFEVPSLSTLQGYSPFKGKKEMICTLHARIQRALCEIELCMQREDPGAMAEAVVALRRAQDAIEAAMERGQAMEDRLYKYRRAFNSLGYVRKKTKMS